MCWCRLISEVPLPYTAELAESHQEHVLADPYIDEKVQLVRGYLRLVVLDVIGQSQRADRQTDYMVRTTEEDTVNRIFLRLLIDGRYVGAVPAALLDRSNYAGQGPRLDPDAPPTVVVGDPGWPRSVALTGRTESPLMMLCPFSAPRFGEHHRSLR